MSKSNYKNISHDKQHAESIRTMVRSVVFEEDPRELDAYRKLIRKNVSIFRRTYLAAYLFKLLQETGRGSVKTSRNVGRNDRNRSRRDHEGDRGRREREGGRDSRGSRNESRPRRSESSSRREREPRNTTPHVQDGIVSLHINCGRMHRLTEDDLRSLISSEVSQAVTDSIQDVRVYDKYTFVYLSEENAEAIISKLTGLNKFDRDLTVSYSKKNIR